MLVKGEGRAGDGGEGEEDGSRTLGEDSQSGPAFQAPMGKGGRSRRLMLGPGPHSN